MQKLLESLPFHNFVDPCHSLALAGIVLLCAGCQLDGLQTFPNSNDDVEETEGADLGLHTTDTESSDQILRDSRTTPPSDVSNGPDVSDAAGLSDHTAGDLRAIDDATAEDQTEDSGAGQDIQSDGGPNAADSGVDATATDLGQAPDIGSEPGTCPSDMLAVDDFCIDRYEAPNQEGELPFVMFTFIQAEAWCEERGRRLCYDDEWTTACEGPDESTYPYGNNHVTSRCNDDKVWRAYNSTELQKWPASIATPAIETLDQLFAAARDYSAAGGQSADHVESLYQGSAAGEYPDCTNSYGVRDMQGNVEEWTRRRDGGSGPLFHGNLKGRFWAETRTCQGNVNVHGDAFRFYEIGFRCCMDRPE
ncbi:MAG: SUMF1/EgtB/PvdO family nonheme iron enzyme [Myxococcales bacterium]|nr:SUMF1/EgtB/PvdO family nonheme iron enzyme [Myxococcales bacterium]